MENQCHAGAMREYAFITPSNVYSHQTQLRSGQCNDRLLPVVSDSCNIDRAVGKANIIALNFN